MFPHAYPIELWQLGLAMLGAALSLWGLWDALADVLVIRRLLRARRDITIERRLIAYKRLVVEVFVLITQGIFVAIGWLGVLNPPPPWQAHVPLDVIARVSVYRLLYLAGTGALACITLVGRYVRLRITRHDTANMERRRENHPPPGGVERRVH